MSWGIIKISAEDYEAMPAKCDGDHLREHFPAVAASMDGFIQAIRQESQGEVVGEIDVIRIPLNLYHAQKRNQPPVASRVLGRKQ